MELQGRVAVITGGTRGIGRAIAEGFLADGASVVINGRSAEKGAQALKEMNGGDRVHFVQGDIKSREGCQAIIDAAYALFIEQGYHATSMREIAEGAGIARCLPAAVAVPADADDVPALARWAKRTGAALIPRGSGSSMAAGAVGPGVVVDLSRLTHLGAVNWEARRIVTGAGALRGDIDRAARAVGLTVARPSASIRTSSSVAMASISGTIR
jgi:NAD(P)-dependent dehydrogenase (short-subunit alcohol dehydrogenase family)